MRDIDEVETTEKLTECGGKEDEAANVLSPR